MGVVSKTGTDMVDAENPIRNPWLPLHSSPVNVRSTHGTNNGEDGNSTSGGGTMTVRAAAKVTVVALSL